MVSISNLLTLGLIGGGILAFYKLGGAGGIGSKIGGGFSSLFDSFTSSIFPVTNAVGRLAENVQNPALNPFSVAWERFLESISKDPNTDQGKFEPSGEGTEKAEYNPYDPFKTTSTNPMTENNNFIAANQSHPTSWNLESLSGVTITGMYNSSTGGSGGSSTGGGAGGGSGATTTGSSTGSSTGGSTTASSSTAASSSDGGNNAGGSSGSQTGGSTGGSTSRAVGRATRYG